MLKEARYHIEGKKLAKKKKKATGIGKLFIIGVLILGAAAAGAFYYINKLPTNLVIPKQTPTVTVKPLPPVIEQHKVRIYLPKRDKKGFHLGWETRTTQDKGDILDAALNCLLATNKESGIIAGLVPKDTRLLSPVRVKHSVATINLSHEFTDNFSGGSDQEAATVNSIVHTLVYNSGGKVRSVRILVEGKTVETLGGHLDLTEPVKADNELLRPGSLK